VAESWSKPKAIGIGIKKRKKKPENFYEIDLYQTGNARKKIGVITRAPVCRVYCTCL